MAGSQTQHAGGDVFKRDVWVGKVDDSGNELWQKSYGGADHDQLIFERPMAVAANGEIFFAAETWTYGFANGHTDAWVVKLDSSGDIVWQRAVGQADPGADQPRAVAATSDGGVIVLFIKGWLVKFAANGSVEWRKSYSGQSSFTVDSGDG